MCGIVGYVGGRPARGLLLAGLQNLEYRGYDSAGISVLTESETGNRIDSARAVGHLSALRERLEVPAGSGGVAVADAPGTTGIGHTRWATHGRVSEENAHPHFDTTDRVHIVLNGIVENFLALKERLAAAGAEFTSETDAEVVAHLVAEHLDETGDFTEAVRLAYNELRGHYAFVAMSAEHPDEVVGARKECPLIIGRSDGEQYLASAIPAFLERDPPRAARQRRRDRHAAPRRRRDPLRRRRAARARGDADRLGRRDRREGRLRDLHAQGDPRAGRRRGRDGRRPHRAARRRRLRRRARRDHRRRPAHDQARRDHRLRHRLPRGPGRPLRDRGVGAGPGRDGHRLRVPLPQPGGGGGRPRRRHDPVGRDGRHAGRDAPGQAARREGPGDHQRPGLAGHARRRRRPAHAGRARGRRGGDQDLRRPGRRDVPARAAPGRAARHAARRAPDRADHLDQAAAARHGARPAPRRRARRGDRRAASSSRSSSSTSAATSGCRSRSRARSSSRRSPTSPPTPTRPAR